MSKGDMGPDQFMKYYGDIKEHYEKIQKAVGCFVGIEQMIDFINRMYKEFPGLNSSYPYSDLVTLKKKYRYGVNE